MTRADFSSLVSHNSSGAIVGNISIWHMFVAPFSRVALDES